MKHLTIKKKELLRNFVNFTCVQCKKNESEVGRLQAHRPKRGGEYSLCNIQMLCNKCHKMRHANEFKCRCK